MARRLIQALEQERTRIGRELHDDINQKLAMLSVGLEQLPENPSKGQSRVRELRKNLREISDDAHALGDAKPTTSRKWPAKRLLMNRLPSSTVFTAGRVSVVASDLAT